ncbi:MAG: hypothetical protein U0903_16350 [Planctomycetales bacterium]
MIRGKAFRSWRNTSTLPRQESGFDLPFVRGTGPYLEDPQGTRYLDCLAGYGVFACGRNHPVIKDFLQQALNADLPSLLKLGGSRLSGLLARNSSNWPLPDWSGSSSPAAAPRGSKPRSNTPAPTPDAPASSSAITAFTA